MCQDNSSKHVEVQESGFARAPNHLSWIPGDWGYIKNMDEFVAYSLLGNEVFLDIYDPGQSGENIIYLGGDEYWGHPGGIKTLKEWEDAVSLWDPYDTYESFKAKNAPGYTITWVNDEDAKVVDWRRVPATGLE